MNLSAKDLLKVLQCIDELYSETNPSAFPVLMMRLISKIVPAKFAAFTEVDPVMGQSIGTFYPEQAWDPADVAVRFHSLIHQHPVVQHMEKNRDGRAKAISDFLTPKQWHSTALYKEFFKPMNIEDQLSIGMTGSAGLMIGLSFNRAKRGFSDRDRQVLNLVRSHMLRAYLHGRELQQMRNRDSKQRGSIVDQLPLGLIYVNESGKILWSTDSARDMLIVHYADTNDSIHGLPNVMRIWLKSSTRAAKRSISPKALMSVRPGFELHTRFCPLKDGQAVLLLQENPSGAQKALLEGHAFTDREVQVMNNIVQGMRPAQVAVKLSISPRTVQKHLERVFRKLGVNSLAAACIRIMR